MITLFTLITEADIFKSRKPLSLKRRHKGSVKCIANKKHKKQGSVSMAMELLISKKCCYLQLDQFTARKVLDLFPNSKFLHLFIILVRKAPGCPEVLPAWPDVFLSQSLQGTGPTLPSLPCLFKPFQNSLGNNIIPELRQKGTLSYTEASSCCVLCLSNVSLSQGCQAEQ